MSVSRLTVAICTWNRAPLLRQTLDALTGLDVPAGIAWELLVVNNNCTDDTDAVLAEFADRLPLRRLFEPSPGVAHARQLAVEEAAGEFVLWTDDDVLVPPDWMRAYLDAFARWPEASVFGGPIRPWFPNAAPRWLADTWSKVAPAYASIDYSDDAFPLGGVRVPFTANAAIRTAVHRAFPFDTALGVRPGSRMGGEETDMVRRALAAGHTGWWVPNAHVRHYVHPERQSLAFLRGWYRAYGAYLSRQTDGPPAPRLLGRPRWLWRAAAVSTARYAARRLTRPPAVWIDDFIASHTARGQLRGE